MQHKRLPAIALAIVAGMFASGELAARLAGLGSPALSITHPTVEYMFAPNQTTHWFGHRVHINAWGMRSPDFGAKVRSSDPPRTLVIGDSVVYGGNLTDQGDVATSLLSSKDRLYMNISAGSWGPPNELAYVKAYGFFDADSVVVVVSSHDAFDVPTFKPLNPLTHPTHLPFSALLYSLDRYFPRAATKPGPSVRKDAIPALRELIRLAQGHGAVCIVLHSTRSELAGDTQTGYALIKDAAVTEKATLIEDRSYLNPATSFRDDIHLSARGQADLAHAIRHCPLKR